MYLDPLQDYITYTKQRIYPHFVRQVENVLKPYYMSAARETDQKVIKILNDGIWELAVKLVTSLSAELVNLKTKIQEYFENLFDLCTRSASQNSLNLEMHFAIRHSDIAEINDCVLKVFVIIAVSDIILGFRCCFQ